MVYASMALILVSLFAMLAAYSRSDAEKMAVLKSGFESHAGGKGVLISSAMEDMRRLSRRHGMDREVQLIRTAGGFKAVMQSGILFDPGQALIHPDMRPYLNAVGEMAKKWGFTVEVQGHTDSVPIHTDWFASNWELSAARAVTVLRYFLEKAELDAQRLSAVGFGPYRPVADNAVADGRAANRRVEIHFGIDSKESATSKNGSGR
jgi:chemotaxis protein MotB